MKYTKVAYSEARSKALQLLNQCGVEISSNSTAQEIAKAISKLSGKQIGELQKLEAKKYVLNAIGARASLQTVQVYAGTKNKVKKWEQTPAFLASKEWKAARYQALVMHGGACMCCGASAKDGVRLNVDHIFPRSSHPQLALDINNLQVLCADCNTGKSNVDTTDWRQSVVTH